MSIRFGTDGIRGRANTPPFTSPCMRRLGRAVARALTPERPVMIGRDTRPSGPMIVRSLAAGLMDAGCRVTDVGVAPSPALSFLVRTHGAAFGIEVTASHNPATDNGVKLFAADGTKLSREEQAAIETAYEALEGTGETGTDSGASASVLEPPQPDALLPYIDHVVNVAGGDGSAAGLFAVIDCARGAACAVAPAIVQRLGLEVEWIGAEPDGERINDGVGALYPERAAERVLETGADIGLSFDGDADRLIVSDERGCVHDGDALLFVLADLLRERGLLFGDTVVATIMSNRGLEDALASRGLRLERTPVGDQHVSERLRRHGFALGGEQSGHIIVEPLLGPTGDGIGAAALLLALLRAKGCRASELFSGFERYPQRNAKLHVRAKPPLETVPGVPEAIAAAKEALGEAGRLIVRYSGTEALLRLSVEHRDAETASRVLEELTTRLRTDTTGFLAE